MQIRSLFGLFCLLSLAVVFSSCAPHPQDEDISHPIHWTSFPIPLSVSPELLADTKSMQDLRDALHFWEDKAGKPLFKLQSDAFAGSIPPVVGDLASPTDVTANLVFFPEPWPFMPNFGAKTAANYDAAVIKHGIVMLNKNQDFCHGDCTDPARVTGQPSERRALAHEFGHFLGLQHVQDISNIMYPDLQAGTDLTTATIDNAAFQLVIQ